MENKVGFYFIIVCVFAFALKIYDDYQTNHRIQHIYIPATKELIREYHNFCHCHCDLSDLVGNQGDFYYTDYVEPMPPLQYSYTPTGTF